LACRRLLSHCLLMVIHWLLWVHICVWISSFYKDNIYNGLAPNMNISYLISKYSYILSSWGWWLQHVNFAGG
jgi:hypothetical protein